MPVSVAQLLVTVPKGCYRLRSLIWWCQGWGEGNEGRSNSSNTVYGASPKDEGPIEDLAVREP